ncbi:hypothetical protein MNBD_GAMMA10-247 [hydrothermal vent metagenome]|uniref:Uncharacterized protein n=1 Tax=hydrothermal vent metagenome TaxID=652676 RepID=A0A3B0YCH4_9ZZZZ
MLRFNLLTDWLERMPAIEKPRSRDAGGEPTGVYSRRLLNSGCFLSVLTGGEPVMSDTPYQPIACADYDVYEIAIMQRYATVKNKIR